MGRQLEKVLDEEWVMLVKEAIRLGLSSTEIREFLHNKKAAKNIG
ncbi:anti-repressor SinI family protein [Evansella sp. AB-rgal1]